MKLTLLGTGTSQGVPVITCQCPVCQSPDPRDKRLRTAALLESATTTIAIDTGPDFRQQMLRMGVQQLDAVVLTHSHRDHLAGLDDIRAFYFRNGGKPFDIYGDAYTLSRVRREFDYFFYEKKYPGVPIVNLIEITDAAFTIGDLTLTPIPVMHHEMPVLGFRCGNLAYITDANFIPPSSMDQLHQLDYLVLNALQQSPHISHFTLDQAIEVVKQLKPREAFFTHISHKMGLHATIDAQLPPGMGLGFDGLVCEG
jgi:phosphoribosyl 1,2-cyclic phosphate phosphodiesterase